MELSVLIMHAGMPAVRASISDLNWIFGKRLIER